MHLWLTIGRAAVGAALALTVAACGPVERALPDGADADRAATQQRVQEQLGGPAVPIDTALTARLSGAFRAAAAKALPAVVQVAVTAVMPVSLPFQPRGEQQTRGMGSGFIIDAQGHILTNNHVVENATKVRVVLPDGREFPADVVGADPSTDVAVIRVDAGGEQLPVSELGDSDQLRVGDWVLALGNPLDLTFTVTAGIVSAQGRAPGIIRTGTPAGNTGLEAFIQTDAAINPGNSGGPLVDLTGRVVGINTAIESQTGFFMGAGFAIPITLASRIARDLIEYGVVHRPRLGVTIDDVTAADAEVYGLPSVSGAEITSVAPGTPAATAGLQLGDVVLEVNDEPVRSHSDLQSRIARYQPDDEVRIGFVRYGQRLATSVRLGQFEVPRPRPQREATAARSANPLGFTVQVLPTAVATRLGLRGNGHPVVANIDPFGPAARSGLAMGHVITMMNGREIGSVSDLERAAAALQARQTVSLVVLNVQMESPVPTIINYRSD